MQAGQEAVEANDALAAELITEYESLRPIFAGQQNTADTLKTLALLEQTRSNTVLLVRARGGPAKLFFLRAACAGNEPQPHQPADAHRDRLSPAAG